MFASATLTYLAYCLPFACGKIDQPGFDEPGYIATPPCMWGSPEHGLAPPPLMNGVTIRVEAVTNNTYGHHGEMALPQAMLAKKGQRAKCAPNATITALPDVTTIYGMVTAPGDSTYTVTYLGNFSDFLGCERAFMEQNVAAHSYTYLTGEYPLVGWRHGCYARTDGAFAPRVADGAISGQCQSAGARYFEPEYVYGPPAS